MNFGDPQDPSWIVMRAGEKTSLLSCDEERGLSRVGPAPCCEVARGIAHDGGHRNEIVPGLLEADESVKMSDQIANDHNGRRESQRRSDCISRR